MLFLAAALMVGAGIRLFRGASGGGERYDYRAADSEFAVRSAAVEENDSLAGGGALGAHRKGKGELPALSGIDLNRAAKEDLMRLPGIGEKIAERIVLYREKNGPFRTVAELRRVRGIGKKKLERIMPYCMVGK